MDLKIRYRGCSSGYGCGHGFARAALPGEPLIHPIAFALRHSAFSKQGSGAPVSGRASQMYCRGGSERRSESSPLSGRGYDVMAVLAYHHQPHIEGNESDTGKVSFHSKPTSGSGAERYTSKAQIPTHLACTNAYPDTAPVPNRLKVGWLSGSRVECTLLVAICARCPGTTIASLEDGAIADSNSSQSLHNRR